MLSQIQFLTCFENKICSYQCSNESTSCLEDNFEASYYLDSIAFYADVNKKINSFTIVYDSGLVVTSRNLSLISNYQSLSSCEKTSKSDIAKCLKSNSLCTSSEIECSKYINCRNQYVSCDVNNLPDDFKFDFRCLDFFQSSLSTTSQDILLFNNTQYIDSSLNEIFACIKISTSSNDLICFGLALDERIFQELSAKKNVIVIMSKSGENIITAEGISGNIKIENTKNQFKNDDFSQRIVGYQTASCLSSDIGFAAVKEVASTQTNFIKEFLVNKCSFLIFGGQAFLDVSTDLFTAKTDQTFSIIGTYDLNQERSKIDEASFVPKKILFYKFYIEVLLNQLLLLMISKLAKNFVKEITKPLKDLKGIMKYLTKSNITEEELNKNLNKCQLTFDELITLKFQIRDFGYLCLFHQKLQEEETDSVFYFRMIEIFEQKKNPHGQYVIYDLLIQYYIAIKDYEDAIKYAKILLYLLEFWKKKIKQEEVYNHDEISNINSKIFYNYYRLLNIMKKHLLAQGSSNRRDWTVATNSFKRIFTFLDEIEIKETIILKLMIKKANIHYHLGKLTHAEEGIKEAMHRHGEYVKQTKVPNYITPDHKILDYLQQKIYLTYGLITLKKGFYQQAYFNFIKCLIKNQEHGPIYSPGVRSKCFESLATLFHLVNPERFVKETLLAEKMSKFYNMQHKDFLFLIDSTTELNTHLIEIWGLIKSIVYTKMKPEDTFSIYRFHKEVNEVLEPIPKKKTHKAFFDDIFDTLKKNANEPYRSINEALGQVIDLHQEFNPDNYCKIIVVFLFGDEYSGPKTQSIKKSQNRWLSVKNSATLNQQNLEKMLEKIEYA